MPDIYINYGMDAADMTYELMGKANVAGRLSPGMRVCVKPNLLLADRAENGATTHPEIVEGIIRYLQAHGVRDITIAEGAWVGESSTGRAYDVCGYTRFARDYNVKLVDTKKDRAVKMEHAGETYRICQSVLDTDFLINVPVLKAHCQTKLTCCIKNLKGCIPDSEKRRYHSMGLSRPIAALGALLRPDLHVVDSICGDLTFEEGGNPVRSNRILLGFDAVLLDSYCAGLIGYAPDKIGYLRIAREEGTGRFTDAETEICELNRDKRPAGITAANSSIVRRLAEYIDEDSACSACYASLVFALHQLRRPPVSGKVKIGQGYRGKTCSGLGVGNCTAGCADSVKGCPPSALDIIRKLEGAE